MVQDIIGRSVELGLLQEYIASDRSEFVAVYGRRRVGKTFLIRKAVKDQFSFFVTGVYMATKSEQLTNFAIALQKYSKKESLSIQKNWILAFYELSRYLETLPEGKKVIFIDELPWMDTAKSGFIAALENFWNSWAVLRNDIKLIVCGSATSWMINQSGTEQGCLLLQIIQGVHHGKQCITAGADSVGILCQLRSAEPQIHGLVIQDEILRLHNAPP